MRKSSLLLLSALFLPFFVGCNSEELEALQARLEATESKLAKEESSRAQALQALENGQCSIEDDNGKTALLRCGDGTSFTITNGVDGINGINGIDGLNGEDGTSSVVEVIDPCGSGGQFDEVILRLQDGSLLAHYASGNRQFLTLIGPGNYRTTDGLACNFSVDEELNVYWD